MAHRASGRRAEGADPFPWVVCLVSIAVGLTIWFRSTTPSLAESAELERIEQRLRGELESSETATHELGARRARLQNDPETVLVELDRHGIDPASLPPPREQAGADAPSAGTPSADRGATQPRTETPRR